MALKLRLTSALSDESELGIPTPRLDGLLISGDLNLVDDIEDFIELLDIEHVAHESKINHDHFEDECIFELHLG